MSLKQSRVLFICVGLLSLLLVGCATQPPAPQQPVVAAPKEPIVPSITKMRSYKVGLLLPLTGPQADLGKALQHAAEMSLFDHADESVELVLEDTGGTALGASTAARRALSKGVQIVVGPLFAPEVSAVSQVVAAKNMTVLSFSNNQTIATSHTYVMGFSPQEQFDRVLRFAASRGSKRVAAYLPQSEYGHLVHDTLTKAQQQGVIDSFEPLFYETSGVALKHPTQPYSAVLIPESGQIRNRILSSLSPQLDFGLHQVLGSGQWDTADTCQDSQLMGALFAAPERQEREAFERDFQRTYGYVPPRLATLSYDVISLIAALVKRFPQDPFSVKSLMQPQGFTGLDGIFRLKAGGTVERGLGLYEVSQGKCQIVAAAPKRF